MPYVEIMGGGRFQYAIGSHYTYPEPGYHVYRVSFPVWVTRPLDITGTEDRPDPRAPLTAEPYMWNPGNLELAQAAGTVGITRHGTVADVMAELGQRIVATLVAHHGAKGEDVVSAGWGA